MATEKQQAFYRSLRAQGAVQAYRNVQDWMARLAFEEVQARIAEKLKEREAEIELPQHE
jgi:hypothetical protein